LVTPMIRTWCRHPLAAWHRATVSRTRANLSGRPGKSITL
jgi:hypothetical protein